MPTGTDRKKDRHISRMKLKPFVGVDGEGATRFYVNKEGICEARHEYLLLRAGKDHVLETGYPLTTLECLDFLSLLPPGKIYVGYYFNYDVTKILTGTFLQPGLPKGRLERLLNRNQREIVSNGIPTGMMYPVDIFDGLYQIDHLPGKEFSIRKRLVRSGDGVKATYGGWVNISDVGSFFQCSFVKALQQWFGDDEEKTEVIAAIAEGKEKRAVFGAMTEYERRYNLLEIIMLQQLMERFRATCYECGLRPAKWQGPGNIAAYLFKSKGLPRKARELRGAKPTEVTLHYTHTDLMEMANSSYFGGRFEPPMIGDVQGPIHYADINSAYPYVYRKLPCMLHGTWEPCGRQPDSGLYIGEVQFDHRLTPSRALYTLPFRTTVVSIIYPSMGNGIYTSPELDVARNHGVTLSWRRGYRYHPDCDCAPFEWVPEIYTERKRLGKTGKGYAFKLALNSCYGKLAQSIGKPIYSNPLWATLITGYVRAMLTEVALQVHNGEDVVMLATDGLATRNPRLAEYGDKLGQWDYKKYPSIFMIQSGLYIMGDEPPKTRGVPQRKVIASQGLFRDAWAAYNPLTDQAPPTITLTMHNFIGLRLAMHRKAPRAAGTWIQNDPKAVSFDWSTKRKFLDWDGSVVYTRGYSGSLDRTSQPYKRDIGGMLSAARLEQTYLEEDQPDWGDIL